MSGISGSNQHGAATDALQIGDDVFYARKGKLNVPASIVSITTKRVRIRMPSGTTKDVIARSLTRRRLCSYKAAAGNQCVRNEGHAGACDVVGDGLGPAREDAR